MKISHNWLKDYVSHDRTVPEIADMLTMSGLEVDGIERIGSDFAGLVVGRVLATRKHPNADRLTVCDVDLGDDAPVQIVCGAPNVAEGQKVPVATVGTTLMLPDRKDPTTRTAVKIKKAKVRGEGSQGMICAEDELGLSGDHSGIMVLDENAEVGQPFADYLAAHGTTTSDAVYDIAITPNRPDAVSHLGVARDVAALTDAALLRPEVELPNDGGPASEQFAVEIDAPEGCHRYVGILVRGVEIKDSPAWLKARLEAIGLRPRNNVVDVTNYVMYECGQPLHAFDFDELAGPKIIVRFTEAEQPFTTLDDKERTLPAGTLMIADAERDVAIAGVMGGQNSEVTDATGNVLIESAYFDPSTIRRTAKALQLQTDASYRFERGVDPEGQVWAAARAAELIANLAGGEIVEGMVDTHPRPHTRPTVALRYARIEKILGVEIPLDEVTRLLTAIGFAVEESDPLETLAEHALEGRGLEIETTEMTLHCTVPPWRPDVAREIDVIEEVARLYGYDRIPEPSHSALPTAAPHADPAALLHDRALGLLAGLGFRETYTNSLLPRETAERFNVPALRGGIDGGVVETMNPVSQEMAVLRPCILPGVLAVMAHNQNHGQTELRFTEFGHVFAKTERDATLIPGYHEHEALLIALSGPANRRAWDTETREADFFDLKGIVEALLEKLGLADVEMTAEPTGDAVTAYRLRLSHGGTALGVLACLAAPVAEAYDLRSPVYFAELNWTALTESAAEKLVTTYASVSRFPVVERDLAVVVAKTEPVGAMLKTIRQTGRPLLQMADVFDLYEGEHIEAGQKSVAFALRFGADRTLKDKEVDGRIRAILKRLENEHAATLRT